MLQVSNAAVNQPRGPARRSAGEVTRFDERDTESPHRRVACDAGPGNPSSDDRDVEGLDLQAPTDEFPPGGGVAVSHVASGAFRWGSPASEVES